MDLPTCLVANVTPLELPIQNNIVTNGGYGSAKGVAMSIGDPPQFFSSTPAFRANNTWFTLADFCQGTQNYTCIAYYQGVYNPPANVNTTNTLASWNGSSTESSDTRNIFYNANAQVGGREIWGFPFFSYYYQSGGFTNPSALGLGLDSSFINASLKAGITPNKQWSLWPGNNYYNLDGLLILGGYDSDRVTGQFQTYPLSDGTPVVEITGLVWNSRGVITSLMPNGTQAMLGVLDPYSNALQLPTDSLSKFLSATETSRGENYDFFPSSQAPPGDMILTFSNGQNSTIPAQDLYEFPQAYNDQGFLEVTNSSIQRCLVIPQPSDDDTVLLGLPFMTQKLFISDFDSHVFYMADAVKQDFGSSAKNLQPLCTGGPTSTSSGASNTTSPTAATTASKHSSSHVGAIVGGVLGGIAGLALLGILAFCLFRRRKRQTKESNATPEISEPSYNGTPPPKYPHAYSSNMSSDAGGMGTHQPVYNSGSTTPGLGMWTSAGHNQQGHDYSSGNASFVPSARADSERHELESDGPLAATSGPMDLPANYDQRWLRE